jgi:phage-related protein
VFDCQPFAYSVTEETPHFHVPGDTPPYTFTNPGTRVINYRSPQGSKFKIEVSGSWTTLVFTLNGSTLNYNEAGNGTLVLDNIEMEAAMGGVNKYGVLSGAIDTFLKILPGANTLTVGGTGLAITVTVQYIPLWL